MAESLLGPLPPERDLLALCAIIFPGETALGSSPGLSVCCLLGTPGVLGSVGVGGVLTMTGVPDSAFGGGSVGLRCLSSVPSRDDAADRRCCFSSSIGLRLRGLSPRRIRIAGRGPSWFRGVRSPSHAPKSAVSSPGSGRRCLQSSLRSGTPPQPTDRRWPRKGFCGSERGAGPRPGVDGKRGVPGFESRLSTLDFDGSTSAFCD